VTEFGKREDKRKRVATASFEQTCENGPEVSRKGAALAVIDILPRKHRGKLGRRRDF
jgi:hypothetical protein